LNCVTCGALVDVSDEARVGGTKQSYSYVDGEGRRHHVLPADPGKLGLMGGEIGGKR